MSRTGEGELEPPVRRMMSRSSLGLEGSGRSSMEAPMFQPEMWAERPEAGVPVFVAGL